MLKKKGCAAIVAIRLSIKFAAKKINCRRPTSSVSSNLFRLRVYLLALLCEFIRKIKRNDRTLRTDFKNYVGSSNFGEGGPIEIKKLDSEIH